MDYKNEVYLDSTYWRDERWFDFHSEDDVPVDVGHEGMFS